MERLEGRVALVTGAASGIGEQTSIRLADEGATVIVSDINDDAGEKVAAGIGDAASYLSLDVSKEQEWIDAIAEIEETHGSLDILVNNAGMGDTETLEETDLDNYEKTIAINQTSVFLGMKHAADLLKRSDHASVINISSIFGASGGFGTSPAYHAAKGAVRLITKNAALLWAEQGIRVNSVHPGFIDTAIMDDVRGTDFEDAMLSVTPMARLGQPEEIAAGIAYLASDDASFVTGSELYIDGGYMAR